MLSHPNIVTVYDVSRNSDIEYIVMELIEGITLKQYLNKRGVLSWKEALHFSSQIAKALMTRTQQGNNTQGY
jgi:serine/threonine-protein kinase